ncbi:MAG: 2-C-methyl-D-erythritol 2,4-cyclodiphosphate synthase [Candidatus Nitrospinota bacterium M3_3B_026]
MIRVGHGFDAHRLVKGRRLILGGVEVEHEAGLFGHSDADALTHAVIDALLGAAAMGDIGAFFPDSDEKYKDVSSVILLEKTVAMLGEKGYRVGAIDATIAAEAPRLAPYVKRMREKIAAAAGVDPAMVSVKATTTEGLGFTGRGEGIAAWAVATITTGGERS